MNRSILLIPFVLLAGRFSAVADELPTAKPESVGLAPAKLAKLTTGLQKLVDDGKIAGGVASVARHGKIAFTTAFGYRDLVSKTPMTEDTIFRIASMSKPITCMAVMMLVEQGKLGLDDPVAKYLPVLGEMRVLGDSKDDKGEEVATVPARRPITVRQLLTHTSGFAYGTRTTDARLKRTYAPVEALEESPGVPRESTTIADLVDRLSKVALAHQPGEAWTYGLSHDVLGRLVEVVANERFDRYLDEHIFRPLDMHDTAFLVPEAKRDRVATLYRAGGEGEGLSPLPRHYGSATYFSGGGGLFSTLRDYNRFAQMLLQQGAVDGRRIVRAETIQAMTTNQIGDMSAAIPGVPTLSGMRYGLGFGLEMTPSASGASATPALARYFWGGAFSTRFWIDPQHEVAAVLLTQVLPFNHGDSYGVFRQGVDAAVEE
jgi:CubicO group peptidase (beta-lactamase class C family)